jgi:hypothetical protein
MPVPGDESIRRAASPCLAFRSIWCATSPQLAGLGGVYCENCDIAPVKSEGDDGVRPYAIDPATAQRLWAWSERWLS